MSWNWRWDTCVVWQDHIKWKKVGPFVKNWSFEDSWLLAILEKCPTSTMHNFLNFELLEVFLDFLETLRCPLINFLSHLIFIFHSQVINFGKKGVFVDFQKWPIMPKFVTFCECISWSWDMKMYCRKFHPLQNEFWMGHFS